LTPRAAPHRADSPWRAELVLHLARRNQGRPRSEGELDLRRRMHRWWGQVQQLVEPGHLLSISGHAVFHGLGGWPGNMRHGDRGRGDGGILGDRQICRSPALPPAYDDGDDQARRGDQEEFRQHHAPLLSISQLSKERLTKRRAFLHSLTIPMPDARPVVTSHLSPMRDRERASAAVPSPRSRSARWISFGSRDTLLGNEDGLHLMPSAHRRQTCAGESLRIRKTSAG